MLSCDAGKKKNQSSSLRKYFLYSHSTSYIKHVRVFFHIKQFSNSLSTNWVSNESIYRYYLPGVHNRFHKLKTPATRLLQLQKPTVSLRLLYFLTYRLRHHPGSRILLPLDPIHIPQYGRTLLPSSVAAFFLIHKPIKNRDETTS